MTNLISWIISIGAILAFLFGPGWLVTAFSIYYWVFLPIATVIFVLAFLVILANGVPDNLKESIGKMTFFKQSSGVILSAAVFACMVYVGFVYLAAFYMFVFIMSIGIVSVVKKGVKDESS